MNDHSSPVRPFILILRKFIKYLLHRGLLDRVLLYPVVIPLGLKEIKQLTDIRLPLYLYPDEGLQRLQDLCLSEELRDVACSLVGNVGYFQVLYDDLGFDLFFPLQDLIDVARFSVF